MSFRDVSALKLPPARERTPSEKPRVTTDARQPAQPRQWTLGHRNPEELLVRRLASLGVPYTGSTEPAALAAELLQRTTERVGTDEAFVFVALELAHQRGQLGALDAAIGSAMRKTVPSIDKQVDRQRFPADGYLQHLISSELSGAEATRAFDLLERGRETFRASASDYLLEGLQQPLDAMGDAVHDHPLEAAGVLAAGAAVAVAAPVVGAGIAVGLATHAAFKAGMATGQLLQASTPEERAKALTATGSAATEVAFLLPGVGAASNTLSGASKAASLAKTATLIAAAKARQVARAKGATAAEAQELTKPLEAQAPVEQVKAFLSHQSPLASAKPTPALSKAFAARPPNAIERRFNREADEAIAAMLVRHVPKGSTSAPPALPREFIVELTEKPQYMERYLDLVGGRGTPTVTLSPHQAPTLYVGEAELGDIWHVKAALELYPDLKVTLYKHATAADEVRIQRVTKVLGADRVTVKPHPRPEDLPPGVLIRHLHPNLIFSTRMVGHAIDTANDRPAMVAALQQAMRGRLAVEDTSAVSGFLKSQDPRLTDDAIRKVIIWVRSDEGYQTYRNSSDDMLKQLTELAFKNGVTPVFMGPPTALANEARVVNLTNHWEASAFAVENGYQRQLQLFAALREHNTIGQIGPKSGAIDGPALATGMPSATILLPENVLGKEFRMWAWGNSTPGFESLPGYLFATSQRYHATNQPLLDDGCLRQLQTLFDLERKLTELQEPARHGLKVSGAAATQSESDADR